MEACHGATRCPTERDMETVPRGPWDARRSSGLARGGRDRRTPPLEGQYRETQYARLRRNAAAACELRSVTIDADLRDALRRGASMAAAELRCLVISTSARFADTPMPHTRRPDTIQTWLSTNALSLPTRRKPAQAGIPARNAGGPATTASAWPGDRRRIAFPQVLTTWIARSSQNCATISCGWTTR